MTQTENITQLDLTDPFRFTNSADQAQMIARLEGVLRFQDPARPLHDHQENDWEHIESCREKAQKLLTTSPHLSAELQSRYEHTNLREMIDAMLAHHEDGEPFAGDIPKTKNLTPRERQKIKAAEHQAFFDNVLPLLPRERQWPLLILYTQFEAADEDGSGSEAPDMAAQFAHLIDQIDGSDTFLKYCLATMDTSQPEEREWRKLRIKKSIAMVMQPINTLLNHVKTPQARLELHQIAGEIIEGYYLEAMSNRGLGEDMDEVLKAQEADWKGNQVGICWKTLFSLYIQLRAPKDNPQRLDANGQRLQTFIKNRQKKKLGENVVDQDRDLFFENWHPSENQFLKHLDRSAGGT